MNGRFSCIFFILLVLSPLNASNTPKELKDTTIHLNEILVDAYQVKSRLQKVPGSISIITGKEINSADANNFASILHAVPGVYMHSGAYGTSRIVIRGVGSRTPYNTNRIKSYLNDIPITSSDGISTPEDIDLLSISRMEILKGPASTLYGSGLGGSITLHTPTETPAAANALMQYGSFNTLKSGISGNIQHGNFNLFGNISHLQSDGYRENNHFRRTSALTTGKWTKSSLSIEYTLLLMNLNAGIPSSIGRTLYETNPQAAASNWKSIEGYKKISKGIAGMTLTNNIATNWNNRFTVFSRWTDSYEKRPFNNLEDGTFSMGFRDKLNFHSEKWDLAAGMEFVNDTYHWQLDKNDLMINKNSENRNQLSIYGLAYFRPTQKWTITAGGSLNSVNYQLTDQFPENGDQSGKRNFPFIFSPRMGVSFAPSGQLAFYASVGHGFSMPSPEETLLPEGDVNKTIRPEQGIQTEMGVRFLLFGNKTQLDAAIYRIDLTNLLVTKRLTEDIFTGMNAGKTKHQGLEISLKQQIFSYSAFPGNLDLHANYTFSENTFIDFTDNGTNYNGNTLPGIPSQLAQAGLDWAPQQNLQFQSRIHRTGSQFVNDANTETAAGYFTIQLKAAYQFLFKKNRKLEVYSGVNNLTDTRYASMISVNALSIGGNEPRYFYPGLPRHYYGGIRFYF